MAVSVEKATVGPIDRQPKGDCLSLALRITNLSHKPIRHPTWSQSGIAVKLRDQFGGYYNRVNVPDMDQTPIKPGVTIVETLVFEATPAGAILDLDLPIADGARTFRFHIPRVQRTRAETTQPSEPAPPPAVAAEAEHQDTAPAPPPRDPEQDPKVRRTLIVEFQKGEQEIKTRAMGRSSNEAARFQRNARTSLRKSLAKKYGLELEQVERIVGVD